MSAVDQNGEYTDPAIPIELPASVKDETARNKKGSAIPQGEQISIEHLDKTYEKRYLSKKRKFIKSQNAHFRRCSYFETID